MLVLAKNPQYSWPVSFQEPASGGKFEKHSFDATFKRVPQSRLKVLIDSSDMTDVDFCREVVVGWKGVQDEGGEAIPFSQEALEQVLEIPMMAKAIVNAYLESLNGSRAKN